MNISKLTKKERQFLGYRPHRWIILELVDGDKRTQKVLAGWYGGYLDSDTWRLSSGITNIETFSDHYEFHNESGSVYICHKIDYGVTNYSGMILNRMTKSLESIGASLIVIEGYDGAEKYPVI